MGELRIRNSFCIFNENTSFIKVCNIKPGFHMVVSDAEVTQQEQKQTRMEGTFRCQKLNKMAPRFFAENALLVWMYCLMMQTLYYIFMHFSYGQLFSLMFGRTYSAIRRKLAKFVVHILNERDIIICPSCHCACLHGETTATRHRQLAKLNWA